MSMNRRRRDLVVTVRLKIVAGKCTRIDKIEHISPDFMRLETITQFLCNLRSEHITLSLPAIKYTIPGSRNGYSKVIRIISLYFLCQVEFVIIILRALR